MEKRQAANTSANIRYMILDSDKAKKVKWGNGMESSPDSVSLPALNSRIQQSTSFLLSFVFFLDHVSILLLSCQFPGFKMNKLFSSKNKKEHDLTDI